MESGKGIFKWVRGEVNPFRGQWGRPIKRMEHGGILAGIPAKLDLDLVSEYTGNEETPHP